MFFTQTAMRHFVESKDFYAQLEESTQVRHRGTTQECC